jgi:hypothetical protein
MLFEEWVVSVGADAVAAVAAPSEVGEGGVVAERRIRVGP